MKNGLKALILGGALFAGSVSAFAHGTVSFSVGVGAPAYAAPAYVAPAPVYYAPPPPVAYYPAPAPVYYAPPAWGVRVYSGPRWRYYHGHYYHR